MKVVSFIKEWALPVAIATGTLFYLLFAFVEPLMAVGAVAGPLLSASMPYCMFVILYITFCKIDLSDLRPRRWHLYLQLSRLAMALILVGAIIILRHTPSALTIEGAFVCIICPTAAAAAVVTEKLGGNLTSLTVFTIIDCLATSLIIPILFPIVEREAHVPFIVMSLAVLRNVVSVLVAPMILALLTRWLLPRLHSRICATHNLSFYLWCYNLAVVTGVTIHNIIDSQCSGATLAALIIAPAIVAVALFATGKAIAKPFGENIAGGQALGQKNTVVAIWLTVTFLNPLAAVAPGAYVIWQNVINSWQLWYKDTHGYVKW